MTREEAQLYLPSSDAEEASEVYADLLFEFQQFFLRQVPVSALFNSRFERMRRIEEARRVLIGDVQGDMFAPESFNYDVSDSMYQVVLSFQQHQSRLKWKVQQCTTLQGLAQVAGALLENYRKYAACWMEENGEIPADVRITQPEDEVELVAALRQLHAAAVDAPEKISGLPAGSIVRRESFRLSLWNRREREHGKI